MSEASDNLAAAAKTMAASPGAMQLRTLQTVDGLGPTASNTVVLAVPIDIMEAINSFTRERHRHNGRHSPVATFQSFSIGPLESAAVIHRGSCHSHFVSIARRRTALAVEFNAEEMANPQSQRRPAPPARTSAPVRRARLEIPDTVGVTTGVENNRPRWAMPRLNLWILLPMLTFAVCRTGAGIICLNPAAAVGNMVAVASRESAAPDASHTVCRWAIGGNSLSRREVRRMTATTFCDAISTH